MFFGGLWIFLFLRGPAVFDVEQPRMFTLNISVGEARLGGLCCPNKHHLS